MKLKQEYFWLPVLFSLTVDAQVCPIKISERLCPVYAGKQDSAFLSVRIFLDPSLWIPSKTGNDNPLVVAAKQMVEKYPLYKIGNSDSPYDPPFMSEFSPGIPEVLYHNVSVQKVILDSIIKEPYVKNAQIGCPQTITTTLCDTLNFSLDTAWIKISITFLSSIENDTTAIQAFYSRFDTRDPKDTNQKLSPQFLSQYPIHGFAVSWKEFEVISVDPEIKAVDVWGDPRTALFRAKANGYKSSSKPETIYLLNGKRAGKIFQNIGQIKFKIGNK